ncbi:MAG: hypothetical protein PHF31_01265 [Methylobacter sp.]|nr:hypothetical protein [Methylobacter sp.]
MICRKPATTTATALLSQGYAYESGSNRLIGIDTQALSLDAAGNTLSDNQGRRFEYNQQCRLDKVYQADSLAAVYYYNAKGQRTRKELPGKKPQVIVFHYNLNGQQLAETTSLLGKPNPNLNVCMVYAAGPRRSPFLGFVLLKNLSLWRNLGYRCVIIYTYR